MNRALKRILFYFLLNLLLYFIFCLIIGVSFFEKIQYGFFWVLLVIVVLLGEFFGLVFVFFSLKPERRNTLKRAGQLVSTGLFILLLISFFTIKEEDKETNAEHNEDIMKYSVHDHENYIRIAFRKLESEFRDSNELHLNGFSVQKFAAINNRNDTVYNIWFTYFLNDNIRDSFFSKLSVFKNQAAIELFNKHPSDNQEYMELRKSQDLMTREALQGLKQALDSLPAATRQKLKDTIQELLR